MASRQMLIYSAEKEKSQMNDTFSKSATIEANKHTEQQNKKP